MKSGIDRREFLKFGTAGVAGLALGLIPAGCGTSAMSEDSSGFSAQKHSFIIGEDNLSKINPETQVVEGVSPLVPFEFDGNMINIHKLLIPSVQLIEKISQKRDTDACTNSSKEASKILYSGESIGGYSMDSFMGTRIIGASDMVDISAESISSIIQYNNLDLGIEFFHSSPNLFMGKLVDMQDLYVLGKAPPNIEIFGWNFQVRGPDFANLGTCERRKVSHVHLEIGRRNYRNKLDPIVNFHLGAYKDGGKRCFVLWNNKKPYNICWKSCSANKKTLTEMMKWTIVSVAATLGIYISAFILAAIAEALAIALLPVMAVLAI